jgi:hypothetical protein
MQILLPARVRNARARVADTVLQRSTFARELNFGFAQQGADGQVAALLSMQALLALDPHSARVQPRPELLYFTPAGFHVSVLKTLMNAVVMWPSAHPNTARSSQHEGANSMQQAMTKSQDSVEQQQQELQEQAHQEQQQQRDGVHAEVQQQGHFQQVQQDVPFWSQAAFPAWYMWWHIGLLAYHQQQQQGCKAKGSGMQLGTAGSCSSACTASCSKVEVQDLYSSTDAR